MADIRVVGDDVVLVGEIDIAAREQVPAVVAQLNAAARLVTIDISGVTFIDGAGLDALVSIAEAAVAGGATVRYGTSRWVTRYLDLTDSALPAGSMRSWFRAGSAAIERDTPPMRTGS